jgi:hypothetical protein
MGGARAAAIIAATLVLLCIILAVALPYAVLVRIMEYNQMYATVRTPRARLSDAYAHLKTGDVLLFVSASHLPTNSGLTQTFFTHAAMLLREGDLVYTSEAQMGADLMPDPDRPGADVCMKSGAASAPLLTRIKYYTGSTYLMRLSHALDPGREEALKAAAERLHRAGHPYPTAAQAFAAVLLGRRSASRHCFQHVAHLLDGAGLTPLDQEGLLAESGFIRVCHEICRLAGRPLPGGYSYHSPVELLYDIGALSFDAAGDGRLPA